MSDLTFTTLSASKLHDSTVGLSGLPATEWSVMLFLGMLLGWQLARKRDRKSSAPHVISAPNALSSNDRELTDETLHFTQALQWVAYAKKLERAKQYQAAIAIYDQGLGKHPHNFRLWHERGLALAKHQQFQEALTSYDRALELSPHNPNLMHERGDTLLELKRYEEAIAAFDQYLRYFPNTAHILADRGYALYQMGRCSEALQELNLVLKGRHRDQSSKLRAHFYQIECLRQLGYLEAALTSSQKALKQYTDKCFQAQRAELRQQIIGRLTNDLETHPNS